MCSWRHSTSDRNRSRRDERCHRPPAKYSLLSTSYARTGHGLHQRGHNNADLWSPGRRYAAKVRAGSPHLCCGAEGAIRRLRQRSIGAAEAMPCQAHPAKSASDGGCMI